MLLGFASFAADMCFVRASEACTRRIASAYFEALLRQEAGWFDVHVAAEVPSEMAHRLTSFRKGVSRQLGSAVASVTTVVMTVAIGLSLSWRVFSLGVLTTPLISVAGGYMIYTSARCVVEREGSYKAAGGVAGEALGGIRTVTSLGAQASFAAAYGRHLAVAQGICIKCVKRASVKRLWRAQL